MVHQPAVVEKLRRLVQSSIAKHSYESAVFFADKLVTLTNEEPEEIFRLAQVCASPAFLRKACLHQRKVLELVELQHTKT